MSQRRLSVQQSLDPVITKLTSDLEEAATRGDGSVVEITDDMLSGAVYVNLVVNLAAHRGGLYRLLIVH